MACNKWGKNTLLSIKDIASRKKVERLWNANYVKVWSANFMIFFSFMVVTPLLPLYLSETYQADKDTIGLVLSGYTLTALLARPIAGYLVDSFPRRIVLLTSYFLFFAFFAGYLIAGTMTLFAIIRTAHGAPMGAVTVANSTSAIDVLPSSRRAEGICYYGLSNNLATSIAPTVGLLIYDTISNYHVIFLIALCTSCIGLIINATVHFPTKEIVPNKDPLSFDRFFLVKGWSEGLVMACVGTSYGVLATYLAIYGKEVLNITAGTGLWFAVLSGGLILSRLIGARSLRKGRVVENVNHGILISLFGYLLFATLKNDWGYYGAAIIIGLGNGHIWPGMQTMFINLAPNNKRGTANSSQLTCWDIGMGLGVVCGGLAIHHTGYSSAFWFAFAINLLGVLFYYIYVKGHYLRNRLR
ncbi:MAG: MFS transporter [Bacteroidaceae bacterium]|nr:MFS transporter [Bacteroidaceae bacterium]